jgi:putative spermidine/putrescine transport system ATP-binding protein
MAFLELAHIRKSFNTTVAVQDFSLQVERGEFISFLGPSGCGKTTVLRMIAGFERPTSGRIVLNGKDITDINANRRNIGMVFQQYALFPNMSVADNIRFGMKVAGADKTTMKQRADEMLDLIRMSEFGERYPSQLSGGQQQRVALARALAIQPQVLLLDEPLSALDAKIRVSLRQEIRSIQRRLGITTIFVTHDQEEALSISDRIVVMNHGVIEQIGTPLDIYNRPQTQFVASFIGTLNVFQAEVVDRREKRIRVAGHTMITDEALDAVGDTVSIALRPESISLRPQNGHSNTLTVTVDDIYFLGSVVRIRMKMGEQALNVDTFNTAGLELPQIGETTTLYVPPQALMLLQNTQA